MTTWTGLQINSPNGGPVAERNSLLRRFQGRFSVNPALTSKMVSYQGNRDVPGFRWLKYKEGFSLGLIEHLIEMVRPLSVLDPFSGIGTTPIVAVAKGLQATGIEILPVAALAGRGISLAKQRLRWMLIPKGSKSLGSARCNIEDIVLRNMPSLT